VIETRVNCYYSLERHFTRTYCTVWFSISHGLLLYMEGKEEYMANIVYLA